MERWALFGALMALALCVAYSHQEATKAASPKKQTESKLSKRSDKLATAQAAPSSARGEQQQQHKVAAQPKTMVAQAIADKKQGDAATGDSAMASEEYVQIRPEEMAAEGLDGPAGALSLAELAGVSSSSSEKLPAEHKQAADDELNAHLASSAAANQDSIGALESVMGGAHVYPLPPMRPPMPQQQYMMGGPQQQAHTRTGAGSAYAPHHPQRPAPYGSGARGPRSPGPHGGQVLNAPRGYLAMARGKLAGHMHSGPAGPYHNQPMMSPYGPGPMGSPTAMQGAQHPQAHAHPGGQSSRYLPRGAAAGYAAFRDFVRAQAHKYKQSSAEPGAAYGPAPPQAPVVVSAGAQNKYPADTPTQAAPMDYGPQQAADAYQAAGPAQSGGGQAYGQQPQYQQQQQAAAKAKVTIAQAYIPLIAPSKGAPAPAYPQPQQQQYQMQQQQLALNKLYGGHAPQGAGRPEYSKDFGMVIHYPQATVYTEPMTVDQVHKLAGSSITQILEHLQSNLAQGHTPQIRDESNTLRVNQKHHLGHGLTLHAKEYYAPGKGGHYVPTTAAVISSASSASSSGGGKSASGGYEKPPTSASGYAQSLGGDLYELQAPADQPPMPASYRPESPMQLGSGYERVRAAVANSAAKYAQQARQPPAANYPRPPMPAPYNVAPPQASAKPAGPLAEPLGAIANLIGGELESLYNKANSVLSKQLDPELHAHIQAHLKSLAAIKGPLKMSEHDHKYPLALHMSSGQKFGPAHPMQQYPRAPPAAAQPHARPPRPHGPRPRPHPSPIPPPAMMRYPGAQPSLNRYRSRQPPRPVHPHPQQQQQQSGYQQQTPRQPKYSAGKQQEVAMSHQQMMQMLQDFQIGDEQYGTKSQPAQTGSSQGYPNKVIQHKQQQQQQYQQQSQAQAHQPASSSYENLEGLEIPQGPNDQVGEISELLEALKGTLEQHKPETSPEYASQQGEQAAKEQAKTEEVRYLAQALGQVPSYAMQVPVAHAAQSQSQAGDYQQQTAPAQAQAPASGPQAYQQQQQQQPQTASSHEQQQQQYQAAMGAYSPSSAEQSYAQQAQAYAPQSASYAQQPHSYAQQSQSYAQQSQAYGQQSQAYAQPQMTYGQAPAAGQSEGQLLADYKSQAQQVAGQYGTSGAGHQSQGAPAEYEAQQQQQAAGDAYGQQQQMQAQPQSQAQTAYGLQAASPSHPNQLQQQQQQYSAPTASAPTHSQAAEAPSQQTTYSTSEHTAVINHLVPVQQQQQQQAAGASSYAASHEPTAGQQQTHTHSQSQSPTHSLYEQGHAQLTLGAPDAAAFQSAQSLSSFVDSLGEYQEELLRQPVAQVQQMQQATHAATSNLGAYGQLEGAASEHSSEISPGSSSGSSSSSQQQQQQQQAKQSSSQAARAQTQTSLQHPSSGSSAAATSGSKKQSSASAAASSSGSASSSASASSGAQKQEKR